MSLSPKFDSARSGAVQPSEFVITLCCLLAVAALVIVLIMQRSGEEVASEYVSLRELDIPRTVPAGSIIRVDATSDQQSGSGLVTVAAGYGRLEFEMVIEGGSGSLTLPAAVTQHAGVITVTSGGAVAEVTVEPLDVHELVSPLVGPRTIIADGRDESLAVMLPVDRYGNQVADGTSVDVEWQQPESFEVVSTETVDGMAWVPVQSGFASGPTILRSTASSSPDVVVHASAVRIDEVPGSVQQIELRASANSGRADGRSVIAVETTLLTDAFANALADGTAAQLVFDGPSGAGVISGTVQNGVVRLDLVAPDTPGSVTAAMHIHGQVSNEITIDFTSTIGSFEARLDTVGTNVVLRVDHAIDQNGAFIADGTTVHWDNKTAQLRHGSAEIWVPADLVDNGTSTVEILGLEVTVDLLDQDTDQERDS